MPISQTKSKLGSPKGGRSVLAGFGAISMLKNGDGFSFSEVLSALRLQLWRFKFLSSEWSVSCADV